MRDVLRRFRAEQISIRAATAELGLGRSRFYELYGTYLAAVSYTHLDVYKRQVVPTVRKKS